MKQIKCSTHKDFMAVIYSLVVDGLTFDADHDTFTITLLGGY